MTHFDIAIIGAGINGAGTARELSRRGYSVALIDKGDIGSGTSSASSKLLHGGIRYLEHGEFKLVFEACQERYHWLKHAPHLAKKQSFLIPIYRHHKRKKWMIHAGILLYGLLSGFRRVGHNKMLSVKETLHRQPGLNPKGLLGAALYYDAQVDDARMCLECALQAESWGAKIYTYHSIESIQKHEKGYQLSGQNTLKDKVFELTADAIFQATGPWTDIANAAWKLTSKDTKEHIKETPVAPLLRPSIGSHIITLPFLKDDALLISANDGRVFFAIPWHGQTLIGTTDHPYNKNPDTATLSEADMQYLFDNLYELMPTLPSPLPVLGAFTGVRPLTQDTHSTVGATSREHAFTWLSKKHLCVTGGKYTTFRRIAEAAADLISDKVSAPKPNLAMAPIHTLFGGHITPELLPQLQKEAPHLDRGTCQHLINRYGTQALHVLPYLAGNDNRRQLVSVGEARPLLTTSMAEAAKKPTRQSLATNTLLRGEIGYMIAVEKAKTLDDILRRRTTVFVDLSEALLEDTAQACLEAFGWTLKQKNTAITDAKERYIHAPHRLSKSNT